MSLILSSSPTRLDPMTDLLYWYRHRDDLGTHIVRQWAIGGLEDVIQWGSTRGYLYVTWETPTDYYLAWTDLMRAVVRALDAFGVPDSPPTSFSGRTPFGK